MASGRLSFSIALNMVTAQFKQGAEQVKNALRNIQYQVLGMASALGAGAFGVSELASRFVDVARETNRARMALRNISGDAAMYGKNMNYLTNLAQQYGQDLNTLTTNFARFSAASNAAGVSLEDQKKIYSYMTKAITTFGLSGEEANLTYMALGQMMSKGKISSEELRRQIGERIPIAMQAMANAAGVSIQQLDKMLKNGDIYSKDILPRFAEELDKLTGSINVDNIETSVNRLKNAFIKLTDDLKIGEFYKKIVDGATKMLSTIQSLFTTFAGVIVGGVLAKIIKGYLNYQAAAMASHTRVVLSARKAAWEEELAGRNLTKKQQIEIIKRAVSINAAYLNSAGIIKRFGITAVTALRTVGAALASIAPAAFLMAIGAIVGRFISLRNEAKETAKIFDNYKEGFKNSGSTEEIVKLNQLKKLSDEYKGSKDGINHAQVELMGLLGLQKGEEEKINKVIADRLTMLEATARFDYALQSKMDAEKKKREIIAKYGGIEGYNKAVAGYNAEERMTENTKYGNTKIAAGVLGFIDSVIGGDKSKSARKADFDIIKQQNKVISDASNVMDATKNLMLQYSSKSGHIDGTGGSTPTGGGTPNKDAAEEAARAALDALAGAMKPAIASMNTSDDFTEGLKKYTVSTTAMPVQGTRDTTFDYKKTELEKLQEQYDIVKDYWEELKKIAPEALDEINRKEKELMSLSEALKVAELKEDIENLNKDIFSESVDGITGFANSIDSIANSWERVANADMSGWERMIATINALGDSVKGLIGAWETYKAIKELIDTKEKASAALSLINSGKVIAASGSEATADLVAGTAKTFKANAGIPVVGTAIAIAGVAGILALLASLPKFEKGGIIGGSSYSGDKILGRFNSGERVLTRPDQAYLTKVLKGGTTGGGNVEFKIKGRELVGILQQENTRARR